MGAPTDALAGKVVSLDCLRGLLSKAMMPKLTIAIGLLAISGCAREVCINANTYWPTVTSTGTVHSTIRHKELLLDVDSIAMIRIFECGYAYRDSGNSAVALCMSLRIEDSHSFQFKSPSVKIISESGEGGEYALDNIEYVVYVVYEKDGSEQPDSSLELPTLAPVKIEKGKRYGNGRTDRYSFSSDALFYGAASTFAPPMQRVFSSVIRRREYRTLIHFRSGLGQQFTIEMPNIRVDGKEYLLPTVAWAHSSKPVCGIMPP